MERISVKMNYFTPASRRLAKTSVGGQGNDHAIVNVKT